MSERSSVPNIRHFIETKDLLGLKNELRNWPSADIADFVSQLPEKDQIILFRILPHDLAAGTFEYLSRAKQKALARALGEEEFVRILSEMSADDSTALLEELPGAFVTEVLRRLSPEKLKVARTLLGYPPNTVGRFMTPHFTAVPEYWTVVEVLDHIRKHGHDSETLNVIYVVDENGHLIDDLRIRELLVRPLTAVVRDFRHSKFLALKTTDSKDLAVEMFKKYDRTALPVLDSEDKLVGIVTIDDIVDIIERDNTVEMQKLGGSEALNEPYMATSVGRMVRKRAGWLVVLLFGEMLTASAMGFFEGEIAKAVVLALFVPLIISSGGNSGSQATSLIIRAMALSEVKLADWSRVLRREIVAGLLLGLILGIIGFLRIAIWSSFSTVYGEHWLLIGITVGLALVGVVLWGSLAGSMLPFALRRVGLDPATSSAPFVATVVDVTGLIIYFMLALLILRGTVL